MSNASNAFFKRLYRDEQGAVYILMGFAIILLIGVVGIGIDLGTTTMLKTRAQNASDAAAIAAALAPSGDNAGREQIARRYIGLNYPDNYLGSDFTANRASIAIDGNNIRVDTNNVTRNPDLVQVIEVNKLSTRAAAEVQSEPSVSGDLRDLVLVMDASGSMADDVNGNSNPPPKIEGAKTAASLIIDQILCNAAVVGSRIGWIDYSAQCNNSEIGSACTPQIRQLPLSGACGSVRDQLRTYSPRATTNGADAMRVAASLMSASRPNVVRAVIYMTDGINNSYNGVFYGDNDSRANNPALAICDQLKAQGIIVYGIAYSADAINADVIKRCATDPDPANGYYFYAPDEVAITNAFAQITQSIKKIRLTR